MSWKRNYEGKKLCAMLDVLRCMLETIGTVWSMTCSPNNKDLVRLRSVALSGFRGIGSATVVRVLDRLAQERRECAERQKGQRKGVGSLELLLKTKRGDPRPRIPRAVVRRAWPNGSEPGGMHLAVPDSHVSTYCQCYASDQTKSQGWN